MPALAFPFPPRQLFPNFKRSHHWTAYRKPAKAARQLGWGLTAQAIGAKLRQWPQSEVVMTVRITPPHRPGRPADEDGIMGACKHYLDGISDALGVDDAKFRLTTEWLPREGDGAIEISF